MSEPEERCPCCGHERHTCPCEVEERDDAVSGFVWCRTHRRMVDTREPVSPEEGDLEAVS